MGLMYQNSELSMKMMNQKLEENVEHDYMVLMYLDSLSEGKDYDSEENIHK